MRTTIIIHYEFIWYHLPNVNNHTLLSIECVYDARTPGLFKVECSGDAIVALSSKTYCVKTSHVPKISCKGINKVTLGNNTVYKMYENVLFTKIS